MNVAQETEGRSKNHSSKDNNQRDTAAASEAGSTTVDTVAHETEGGSKKRSSKVEEQRGTAAAWEAESTLVDKVVQETEGSTMMRSSEACSPRGGFAHHEHRCPDGWTSTPRGKDDEKNCSEHDETSSQPLVKTGGEEDAHYTIEYTGCSSSCDLRAGERLPKQRSLGDEHPERIPEEHLGEQMIHQVGEAGSIVLQISRSLSVFENESKELQETTSAAAKKNDQYVDKDVEILRLIEERRKMPKEERQRLKELSKEITKCIREKKRMKRHHDIERILEEFKGVRNIPRIKSAKKRVLITKIKNKKGECITSRKGIADTFGEYYKRLYEDSGQDNSEHEKRDDKRIPEITSEKLQSAISKLKAGKSPDGNGIRAEDIKDCSDETREMMRQIFNEVIKRNNFTPEEWKKVKIKVIYKKGDVEDVSNYRPICSLPAMYKLFSTILYGRLYPMLDQNQAEDQAGFRKTYQTTDHLATYRMLEQKCQEWRIKMWTATVDFMKAFDSISHNSIWEALLSCKVDHGYVCLLRKIYKDQKASVQTDEKSEIVDIQKGSKQGAVTSCPKKRSIPLFLWSQSHSPTMLLKNRRHRHLEHELCDFDFQFNCRTSTSAIVQKKTRRHINS